MTHFDDLETRGLIRANYHQFFVQSLPELKILYSSRIRSIFEATYFFSASVPGIRDGKIVDFFMKYSTIYLYFFTQNI